MLDLCKFLRKKNYLLNISLVSVLILQIFFWSKTNHIKPDMIIVPAAPSKQVIKLLSFGDDQFYFRQLAFKIQNAGDTWGRFTSLKDYNYVELEKWFYLLDELDPVSNFIPTLASYYYSQSQNGKDTIHVINYLRKHASLDPRGNWWWLSQAVYIANYKYGDKKLALEIAKALAATPKDVKIPIWARQMPAFIYEQLGEREQAKQIVVNIIENYDDLTPEELNFIEYFIKDRVKDKKFKFEVIDELRKRALAKRAEEEKKTMLELKPEVKKTENSMLRAKTEMKKTEKAKDDVR